MALSDEWLHGKLHQADVKSSIRQLVSTIDARAAFLVDEEGTPFATVGSVEFSLPHPLSKLDGGEALIGALVGEPPEKASHYVVSRAGSRALLVAWMDRPLTSPAREGAEAELQRVAGELERIFDARRARA